MLASARGGSAMPERQAEGKNAPAQSRGNLSKLFQKRRSPSCGEEGFRRPTIDTTSSSSSASSAYAGPQPTTVDGRPLKSCLKFSPRHSFASSSSRSGNGEARSVSFSHVQIREYCRQAGDNPSVSGGCPLTIGWKFNNRGIFKIDGHEADRDEDRVPCRRLSAEEREELLTDVGGVSPGRIMQGQVDAYFGRQLRAETLKCIGGPKHYKSVGPRERLLVMKESAARKLVRAKRGTSSAGEQQMLWDRAHEAARRRQEDPREEYAEAASVSREDRMQSIATESAPPLLSKRRQNPQQDPSIPTEIIFPK